MKKEEKFNKKKQSKIKKVKISDNSWGKTRRKNLYSKMGKKKAML